MTDLMLRAAHDTFTTRLATLEHLLDAGLQYFGNDEFLQRRLIADMHPLGTQVAFTCNQPRNFARWTLGLPAEDLDPQVTTLPVARSHLAAVRQTLAGARLDDTLLQAPKRLGLGPGVHLDLTGQQYLQDFLLPNFYFHLVTTYDILRMAGVPVGKRDYMLHLVPLLKAAS